MPQAATTIAEADLNDAAQALEIRWEDGHSSAYPLKHLRAECPCAQCRTDREEARGNPLRVLGHVPSAEVTNVEAVGRYGIRFTWGDRHDAGIYTFEYLREICPCESCRGARPADAEPFVHGIFIPGGRPD